VSDDAAKRLAKLKAAFESGALDEDTYRAAAAALTSTVNAELRGSGAIAQGEGAVAAGAGGVAIGGNLQGSLYLGPPPKDDAEALAIYRRVVAQQTSQLPLRGVDVNAADPTAAQKQLGLANVYINLDTKMQVELTGEEKQQRGRRRGLLGERETRPLGALEALIANRQMVLLGDPGGGKSTFVNHMAFCLASHTLQPEANWIDHLPNWPAAETDLLPIVVILRDFARQLPDPLPKPAGPIHLWNFVTDWLKSKNLSEAGEALHRQLQAGKALVLLDGLDEVPSVTQRIFVREAVMAFVKRYEHSRFLATCRVLSYQPLARAGEPDLRLPDLPSFELAPFDEVKIDRFTDAWYGELARLGVVRVEDTQTLTRQLRGAIRRPDLWRLASNPLLLTVMALVHTHKGRLPDARALLYEETIDILLWRWEQVKGTEELPRLRQLLLEADRTEVDLKRVLWQLAYEAHAQIGDDGDQHKLADIGEAKLLKTLAALKDLNWAQQIIEAMKLRAGLLLERAPEVFTFPHRTFQEYLAGAHLTTLDFACDGSQLIEQGPQWREAILLAVGRLVHLSGEVTRPLALVGELCPSQTKDDTVNWRKTWLAGDALVEISPKRVADSALGRDLAERVSHRLVDLIEGDKLSPRERTAAGNTLARLGDFREAITTVHHMEFCAVPGGPFWMGSERSDEKTYYTDHLNLVYWIGRYPITNAQFGLFVTAGGYKDAHYWVEAAAVGVWRDGQVRGDVDRSFRDKPHDFDDPSNLPNHPVVGITWYEALAFTRWLTEKWNKESVLPRGFSVQLPSEAEWEKAARGGLDVPSNIHITSAAHLETTLLKFEMMTNPYPKRSYPWGQPLQSDVIDTNLANSALVGIGASNAVGCFSRGVSPTGGEEMSGNVWEWTRSSYEPYPYNPRRDGREFLVGKDVSPRVLRGGAYDSDATRLQCHYRIRNLPTACLPNFGFRVMVGPAMDT
jgi:formylglycine-generating enzyme required for sulfatase activity